MSKKALEVYNETAERWFMNPMSYKDFDPEIDRILNEARHQVIDFVDGDHSKDRVIFTSGATESLNILLKGYYLANFESKRKIVTSPIEHKAVLETIKYLETIGAEIEFVNLCSDGAIDYDHLEEVVDSETLFVCLMHVNNETGEITDLDRVYDICQSRKVPFFTDTTQSLTKLRVSAGSFDACVGSGHKFKGPKGVGFLYHSTDLELENWLHGGSQEYGRRSGTSDLPAILSMVSQLSVEKHEYVNVLSFINTTMKNVNHRILGVNRIQNILPIELYDIEWTNVVMGQKLIPKFVHSSGSACSQEISSQSHVYKLLTDKYVMRLSL